MTSLTSVLFRHLDPHQAVLENAGNDRRVHCAAFVHVSYTRRDHFCRKLGHCECFQEGFPLGVPINLLKSNSVHMVMETRVQGISYNGLNDPFEIDSESQGSFGRVEGAQPRSNAKLSLSKPETATFRRGSLNSLCGPFFHTKRLLHKRTSAQ